MGRERSLNIFKLRSNKKGKRTKESMHSSEKELIRTKSFIAINSSLLSFAIIIALIIYWGENLKFDPSYEGLKNAVRIFSIPISILFSIPAISAILAANHRSIQTSEAIKQQQNQNLFSNYLKHKEEFEKSLNFNFKDFEKELHNELRTPVIHDKIFPTARCGNYNINPQLSSFYSEYSDLCESLESSMIREVIERREPSNRAHSVRRLYKKIIYFFYNKLGISLSQSDFKEIGVEPAQCIYNLTHRAEQALIRIERASMIYEPLNFKFWDSINIRGASSLKANAKIIALWQKEESILLRLIEELRERNLETSLKAKKEVRESINGGKDLIEWVEQPLNHQDKIILRNITPKWMHPN